MSSPVCRFPRPLCPVRPSPRQEGGPAPRAPGDAEVLQSQHLLTRPLSTAQRSPHLQQPREVGAVVSAAHSQSRATRLQAGLAEPRGQAQPFRGCRAPGPGTRTHPGWRRRGRPGWLVRRATSVATLGEGRPGQWGHRPGFSRVSPGEPGLVLPGPSPTWSLVPPHPPCSGRRMGAWAVSAKATRAGQHAGPAPSAWGLPFKPQASASRCPHRCG